MIHKRFTKITNHFLCICGTQIDHQIKQSARRIQNESVPTPSVKQNVIGCSENVLGLVSTMWPLFDWLESTVGF